MCGTCSCSDHSKHHHHDHDHDHEHHHHDHAHEHEHHHHHHDADQERVAVEIELLSKNNQFAERNKGYFEAKEICAFNMMSSPGSGKTTLLEKTVSMLKDKYSICVVEGDQQTTNDADRIKAAGAKAIQINTGTGCHLEAEMVNNAVKELKPADKSLLFIENVGNLVCPAMFDLGEQYKVVVVSTTEGDDKPLKYPQMFYKADICVINKIDLAPYLKTNIEVLKANILKVNHHLQIFEVSAESGAGMDKWCDFLAKQVE